MKRNQTKPRDAIAAFQRKSIATRAIGEGRSCACGETRPEAVVACSLTLLFPVALGTDGWVAASNESDVRLIHTRENLIASPRSDIMEAGIQRA
jgi:hypothetical protein